MSFFFNDTATTEIYTLSLHDALPIFDHQVEVVDVDAARGDVRGDQHVHQTVLELRQRPGPLRLRLATVQRRGPHTHRQQVRSEEHTSELQSRQYLVCRLLLEKKKTYI